MRIVFSGANQAAVKAAEKLIKQCHEVIFIEINKEKIDDLSDNLDCSFILGDSGKPTILSEAAPEKCDFLFCLTNNDQANIITSLLAKSMGFNKIITCIEDEDLLPLCDEMDLTDVIIPDRTMSQYLTNTVNGLDSVELSTLLRGNARFFSFKAKKDDAGDVDKLDLPGKSRAIYYYRDDDFFFTDEDTTFRKGDEIVILTSTEHLADLNKRCHPHEVEDED